MILNISWQLARLRSAQPSAIYDLPFLSEKAKHGILGGSAARIFNLPPRNDKQRDNLRRFGNLAAA